MSQAGGSANINGVLYQILGSVYQAIHLKNLSEDKENPDNSEY